MASQSRDHALDHVVLVVFENRSLDNVLGRLYGPQDGKTFEGVTGRDLTNPIPAWAEHGADRKVVPYTVAADMDSPNPDTGEEYAHTNTQLFNILGEHNRFKLGEDISAPHNAPEPGRAPTMDGFVTDYISTLTGELGRQPTYGEYAQVMTGFTPEQIPVLSGLARAFGVFDHWFSEVPSQTFTNRSFWTAATASGFVVNSPVENWVLKNDAETIFNRLEQHGRTWKVYVGEPDRFSITGLIHYPRLKDHFDTHFVPFSQFETDAGNGDLPDFSFIEPCLVLGHGDYHPAFSRVLGHGVVIPDVDPPSSILGGEAFLARIYNAYRAMRSPSGSNVWNTSLLIGWDEPGGTYDHVPPGPVPPPDPSAPAGQLGFTFDRSGYRVPAVVVSPWVAAGAVFNEEHRHTSLIATLREQWDLGAPFTARDAAARTVTHAFALETPRDPHTWPSPAPRPVPQYVEDALLLGRTLSTLGKAAFEGIRGFADHHNIRIEGLPDDPKAEVPPEQALQIMRDFLAIHFPRLVPPTQVPQTPHT
ncbi:phosphoesterase [Streptomyces nojiriensis]|uniref:Phosphoesterase n=1 Tax=Streptomyces nojiriensis TaxID=66374 RepID=A0ABQ3SW96_9ACTN|nr:alkaline phosphatase family protein [Streptomyces nojiriensis]QTI45945.1 Phospholipase C 2 [Streptomyces nojiriensis]GGR89282.1 phosphoesterase [Streptomyces nojiriensis]GHI72419.1 phosphoesterase [Streptomyces nojiriensis]